jgi:hypothetical protein
MSKASIEVVVPKGHAIGERREIGRSAPVGADDARATPCLRKHDIAADADGRLVERRDPATKRIDEMGLDAFDRCGVEILIAQAVRVGSKPLSERTGRLLRQRRCGLRASNARRSRKRGSARCQSQKLTARMIHGGAP